MGATGDATGDLGAGESLRDGDGHERKDVPLEVCSCCDGRGLTGPLCSVCESYNEDWASILARHEKFHNAMQVVISERLWSQPADWQEAVKAARYMQKPNRKIEDVEGEI